MYPYLNHSGSLTQNTVGYEVSVPFPASNLYNLGYTIGNGNGFCLYQPVNRGGSISYLRQGSYHPRVQIYDQQRGWRDFQAVDAFIGSGSLGGQGQGQLFISPAAPYTVTSPVSFRISYFYEFPGAPTVSWTGLNVGFSDACYLPPASPAAVVGTGECGAWSLVGAPNTSGTVLDTTGTLDTLPNGAPLGSRNRVQLIS